MLDRLTATSFAPAVGETFTLDADGRPLELELIESRLHDPDAPAEDPSGRRAPFSLLFRGPMEPILPQRIYHLEHVSVGAIDIFIVPVAHDDSGTIYEAVFG